jgi:hypothetical protein
MEAISDLPMLNDIDADYSPQYVKLARIIRGRIESGEYKHGDPVPAAGLVHEHKVSMRVAWAALAMLAANKYLTRPSSFKPYHVTWGAQHRFSEETAEPTRNDTSGLSDSFPFYSPSYSAVRTLPD